MRRAFVILFILLVAFYKTDAQESASGDSLQIILKSISTNPLYSLPFKKEEYLKFEPEPLIYNDKDFHISGNPKIKSFVKDNYLRFGIPLLAMTYCIWSRESGAMRAFNESTSVELAEHIKKEFPIDDYIQYLPGIGVLGLDFIGVKARHNLKDRIILMAVSHSIMGITVNTMKQTIPARRPDGSNNNTFPSGHTALAFTGAHMLFREYWQSSRIICLGGYSIAAATGVLRIINQKHYTNDVIMGAAIGVLSVEMAYLTLPLIHRLFDKKEQSRPMLISPVFSQQEMGVYLSYTF